MIGQNALHLSLKRFAACMVVTLLCLPVMSAAGQENCDPALPVDSEAMSAIDRVFSSMEYSTAALDAAVAGDLEGAYRIYDCGIAAFPNY